MPSAVVAGVSAAGSIAQGVGSIIGGGGSSTSSGYTLPPELAMQMLNQFQTSLKNTYQQQQQNQQMMDLYNDRADVINSAISGSLPTAEAMKSLQQSSTQIAMMFGGNTMEAIKQGFLDKGSAEAAGLIKEQAGQMQNFNQGILDNLKQMQSSNFVDPALKHQQEDQRRQLQQDLQRQGVSPAGQQAALSQFDRQSSDQLFSRSQDLMNQTTQRAQMMIGASGSAFNQYASGISSAAGLQLQGQNQAYNQAMGQYGQFTGALAAGQQGYAGLSALQGNQFNLGQANLQTSRQLNADTQNAFNQIGQYQFNGDVSAALKAGLAGNQTFYQQTGYVRGGGPGGIKNVAGQQQNIDRYSAQANQVANYGGTASPYSFTQNNPQTGFGVRGNQFGQTRSFV